jgi:hypothetical protein
MNNISKIRIFLTKYRYVVIILHFLLLLFIYKLLIVLGVVHQIHNLNDLQQWDANWYNTIRENGYFYSAETYSNSGFFPLFSYTWRFLGIGPGGISLINALLFLFSLIIIVKALNINNRIALLFLSIPSIFFMYVPYTEAFFFFFSSLIIYGLVKNNYPFACLGFLFASMTRPTAIFFIPAIIVMEMLCFKNWKSTFKNIILYSFFTLLGLFIVIIIQWHETGVWLAYFKAQSIHWKRVFQLPAFPLTTWGGMSLLWIDGLALLVGMFSIVYLFVIFLKRIILKKVEELYYPHNIFSYTYLALAIFSIIFFNGKDGTGGTSMMAANRYVLATVFFLVFLNDVFIHIQKSNEIIFLTLGVYILVFIMLGIYRPFYARNYIDTLAYFGVLILYYGSYVLLKTRYNIYIWPAIFITNVILQILLFNRYSQGIWVG